jgi:hypothetical protein
MRARIANALKGSHRARERLAAAVMEAKMIATKTYEMREDLDDAILDLRDAIIASQARRSRPESKMPEAEATRRLDELVAADHLLSATGSVPRRLV